MFVWPDLREAIIKDSSSFVSLDVERLGEDLVKNLRPTWSYTSAMPISMLTDQSSTSLIASLDILTMIEQQAMTWEFWKLGPGFIEKFPQFVGCQLG